MRLLLTFSIALFALVFGAGTAQAQSADELFHMASGQYIGGNNAQAVQTVDNGLRKYPKDAKLNALKEKLKQEQKDDQNKDQNKNEQKEDQNKDQKDNKDQQNKDQKDKQDQKDQQGKDKEGKDQEKKSEKGDQKKPEQKKDQQGKPEKGEEGDKNENQKQNPGLPEKLQEMNMTPEKAQMILDAMKTQEKQYIQQMRRKATKPKDRSKPDW
jgi:outer membrane biosynthesis protein TonB